MRLPEEIGTAEIVRTTDAEHCDSIQIMERISVGSSTQEKSLELRDALTLVQKRCSVEILGPRTGQAFNRTTENLIPGGPKCTSLTLTRGSLRHPRMTHGEEYA